jgi:anti-anti-sigma factor
MDINTRKENNITVITVTGRMDAVTAPVFEKSLSELIAQGEHTFVVNLSALEYISSAGLRSILASAKQLKSKNGEIIFAGLRGAVEEVFKISGFHSIFKVFDTEEKALKKI